MALDQNIVNLAKAIRQVETGNRQVSGASGELASRYQFMPATWKSSASKYLGDANAPLTLENENKVAYLKLKDWKDAGYNPAQIASMWNSGSPNWKGKVGVNSAGVKYNVPAYVDKVYAEYQKQKAINPPQTTTTLPELTQIQPYQGDSGIMSGLSSLTQKGFEAYAGLPVVKQFGQAVGGLVGGVGGLIGGLLGGVAETGRQIYKGVKGEGVNLAQIPKTAAQVGKETAAAGYQMGSGGATMPPLGLLGRVPNVVVATTQLYEGAKNIKEAAETGDALKGTEGATQLAMGLIGGRYSIKSGKQGILISPKVSEQIKSELIEVGLAKEPTIKAAEVYRNVLKPSKTEVKNIEIRKGSDINNSYKFMAEKGVIVDKTADNKLSTVDAVTKLRDEMTTPSNELNKILASQSAKQFNLLETLNKANREIDKETISAFEKVQKKNDIKEIIIEEIRARNGNPNVSGVEYNTIKQGMWRMGYNALKPTANKSARKIGYIIKEDINNAYKDTKIKQLNEELGNYATAIQLLENAHGRVISGGVLGRGLARGVGAIAGATTKIPIVGPLVGERAGAAVVDYLRSPKRLTTKYSKATQQELPPSIIAKTKKIKPGLTIEDVSKITGYHITRSKRILKKIEEEGFNLKSFGQRSGAKEAGDPMGVYFFPDESFKSIEGWKDLAKSVGVIERELNLKKPFEFKTQKDLQKYVDEIINPAHLSEGIQFKNFQEYVNYRADLNTKFNSSKAITEELQRQGYDSVIDKNSIYSQASLGQKEPQIIVLDVNIPKKNSQKGATTPEALVKGGLLMAGTGLLGSQTLKAMPGGGKAEKELEDKQTPITEVQFQEGRISNTKNISQQEYQNILDQQDNKKEEQISLQKFVPQKYQKTILENAKKYNVSPSLISAIINVENRSWNEKLREIGNKFSTSIGLGQINDVTYKDMQKIVGKFDRTNGQETITAIAAWLDYISKRIKSTNELDIANAYNQGISGHNQGRRNKNYISKIDRYLKS